jgi:hypothetical protein
MDTTVMTPHSILPAGLLNRLSICVLCGLTSFWTTTHAADLTLGLNVSAEATAGLDAPTRELIEHLPRELREQVIEGLKEALPLIDEHATEYLSKANDVIDAQINHASCAALGTTQGITRIFGATLTGTSPKPIGDMDKEWEKTRERYGLRSSPHDIVIAYADFLALAALTSCEVASSVEARETVALDQSAARWRWDVWKRVVDECSVSKACMGLVSMEVHGTIKSADPADLLRVNAVKRLKTLDDTPIPDPGWLTQAADAVGMMHVSLGLYEERMSQLYRIENDVLISRLARGRALFRRTQLQVAEQQKKFADAKPKLAQPNPNCSQTEADSDDLIVASMTDTTGKSAEISRAFVSVAAIEPRLKSAAQSQSQEYSKLVTQMEDLKKSASGLRLAMNGHLRGQQPCLASMKPKHTFLGIGLP